MNKKLFAAITLLSFAALGQDLYDTPRSKKREPTKDVKFRTR